MALATYVPSLSEDGWVNSPILMGDYLLSHFFLSDFSQTELYNGSISSLPYLITQYQGNISGLLSAVQTTLQQYLSRYFSSVTIETNQVPNPTNSSQIGFSIYVSYVGADGVTYTLDNLIQTMDSKISSIIKTTNG